MKSNTIISLITPPLNSAVAVIRLSGDDAFDIASKMFSRKLGEHGYSIYGNIINGDEVIDQVLLVRFKGPKSFTGEDVVEISCHGSMLIANQIISLAISLGARMAERGEFSSRAFYNGKIDLVQAEAIMSIIEASTIEAKKLALYSLEGETSKLVSPIVTNLADLLSNIEVNIDYPEYQDIEEITIERVQNECEKMVDVISRLLGQSKKSQYIVNGINVAIVGLPNTGKSSLLNAFLNEDKAIVSNIPGTTRDIVEGNVSLNGLPLHLLDTAGIRESDNIIEKIGIERSEKTIEKADLIIMVLDASRKVNEEENELLERIKDKKHIIVYNKADLLEEKNENNKYISAINKDIDSLKEAILKEFDLTPQDITPSLCSSRQIGLLEQAKTNLISAINDAKNGLSIDLIAVSLKQSYDNLKEILGENVNVDLSEEIFSRFCVGK